jgi:hypothetical protein
VVERLLKDAEWSKWSNYEIARHCGVSSELVRKLRPSLPTVGSDHFSNRTYVDRWGNTAAMHTGAIGHRSESPMPLVAAHPAEIVAASAQELEIPDIPHAKWKAPVWCSFGLGVALGPVATDPRKAC